MIKNILLFLSVIAITGCSFGSNNHIDRESHELMVSRLDSINLQAKNEPLKYFYANEYRLTFLNSLVQANPDNPELQYRYALELQNSIDPELSVPILTQLYEQAPDTVSKKLALQALSVSYLRLAELTNCVDNYTPSNCILPFDEQAIHQEKSHVQSSIRYLEKLLNSTSTDYIYRWIYNIAHIANGTYPIGVQPDFLISGLQNSETIPATLAVPVFRDRGMADGAGDNRISGSSCVEDFDGNDTLDVFATSYGFGDNVTLYLADEGGTFTNQTESAGLMGITGGLNIECADINNSGYTDVLVLRGAWLAKNGGHPNSLLRNNGDGTFTDITIPAGLYEEYPAQVAAFADLNHDGYLDIFIGNESSSGWQTIYSGEEQQSEPFPSAIFMNNGDETFTRHEFLPGFSVDAFVKGASWGDVDNDGYADLYVSVMGGRNLLFMHRGLTDEGLPTFQEVGFRAGVTEPEFSFPAWFFDFDNDGLEDLFVVSYDVRSIENVAGEVAREHLGLSTESEYSKLYKNMGDGRFRDVTEESGLQTVIFGMGANFADLNNNGYPDIYIGTGAPALTSIIPNRLFLNNQGQKFFESTAASGVGHLQKGHGVSMADFNSDGRMDIYTVLGGAVEGDFYHNALFENGAVPGNWLMIELEGITSNRQGIGARIEAVINDKGVQRSLYRTVSTGGSFGANNTRVHFGLDTSESVEEIRIRWPGDDLQQVIENPKINRIHFIVQE